MSDRILPRMLEALRSTAMPLPAQLEVSLRGLAWAKLSQSAALPPELRLSSGLIADPDRLMSAQSAIADLGGLLGQAFLSTWRVEMGSPAVREVLDFGLRAAEAGLLNEFDASDAITYLPPTGFAGWSLPGDIASLLVALADVQSDESVYVAWDSGGQIATRAKTHATDVYLESPIRSAIPALVALLTDRSFDISFSDPIDTPSFRVDGRPRKFDVAISFPPMGQRHSFTAVDLDLFNRFPERTQSGSVLAVRHLLAQAKRRVVVAVPNNLTFSPGAERSLREDLVRRGIVRAVIAMPPGLLESTSIAFTILVLEPSGGRDAIQFVDASQGALLTARAKGRTIPIMADSLIDLVKSGSDAEFSRVVSNDEVLANDAQLQTSRYLIPKAARELQAKLEAAQTVLLGDVVTTARPMSVTKDESATAVGEIGAADIPAHGYITKPGRTVHIEDIPKNRQNFLQPLDVVLIVKGSVGKVGIVPTDVPRPGPGGWVAGQSAIILRVSDDRMDPRALALQLRSRLGQQLLKQIVSGATIPLIQVRELTRLSVLVPDKQTIAAAAVALEKEGELQQQIEALQNELTEISADVWPNP